MKVETETSPPEFIPRSSEEPIRDWIRLQSGKFHWMDLAYAMQLSRDDAEYWINYFADKGTIGETGTFSDTTHEKEYVFLKPIPGGPLQRPRTAEPPSHIPGPITSTREVVRGKPAKRSPWKSMPEHVRRVKNNLVNGVRVEQKGNEHIFFYLGDKYTWTSHSPKNKDDEHAQLVRRLKREGMWSV